MQHVVQRAAGTLRGLHYQAAPHGEAKLVRCTRGAIFDVDRRPAAGLADASAAGSALELTRRQRRALFIPAGLAHGFQTLEDDTEVLYQMGHEYVPEAARGVRWDDPAFGIEWPEPPPGGRVIISERDAAYPDFRP